MLVRHLPWLVIAALYCAAYAKLVLRHGIVWAGWADQTEYLRSARAFAALRFDPSEHWYPLLYPLLGAPFVRLWPTAPFFLVDMLCLIGAFIGFTAVARRFGIGSWMAAVIFAASTILYPEIGRRWLEPWTTTPSAALIWLGLAQTFAILTSPPGRWRAIAFAVCLALIPMVRPGDAIVTAVLGLSAAIGLLARRDLSNLAIIAGTGAICLSAYIGLHLAIYGFHLSDYALLSGAFGENSGWIGWKAYLLLINPRPWFPDGEGLLHACPWLIFGAAGMIYASIIPSKHRIFAVCFTITILAYTVTMLAYVDFLPSGLWRFNNIHYFKWMFPGFLLFLVIFVRDLKSQPKYGFLILLSLFIPTCLKIVPISVGTSHPARMLIFEQKVLSFQYSYFSRSAIIDHNGASRNIFDYRQVPTGDGRIFAVALRRDFVGSALWTAQAPGLSWPRSVPNFYSPWNPADQSVMKPISRLAPRIEIGLPCWTRITRCDDHPL